MKNKKSYSRYEVQESEKTQVNISAFVSEQKYAAMSERKKERADPTPVPENTVPQVVFINHTQASTVYS